RQKLGAAKRTLLEVRTEENRGPRSGRLSRSEIGASERRRGSLFFPEPLHAVWARDRSMRKPMRERILFPRKSPDQGRTLEASSSSSPPKSSEDARPPSRVRTTGGRAPW